MIIPTLMNVPDSKQAMNILPVLKRVISYADHYTLINKLLKMANRTTLSQPGIFLLASISEILELAGLKEGIGNGQLKPKIIDISPGERIYRFQKQNEITKIERNNGVPYDMDMRDALNKKFCPLVTVSGLDGGLSTSQVSLHAMVAFGLTSYDQE